MADNNPAYEALPADLKSKVLECVEHQGQVALRCRAADQRALLENFRLSQGYDFLVDVTAMDHLGKDTEERFEIVYVLRSLTANHTFRLHAWLDESDNAIPSVFDLWDSARWGERETHDMFGIVFDGNPDLRRFLMPEDYPAFPLLKDYPLKGKEERRQSPKWSPVVTAWSRKSPIPTPRASVDRCTPPSISRRSVVTQNPENSGRNTPVPSAATLEKELEKGWRDHRSGARPSSVSSVTEDDGDGRMVMNFGPQHPATHGTLRSVFTLEGESIVEADVEIGYLHTGFEKLGEHMTYQQWVTVSDRMDTSLRSTTTWATPLRLRNFWESKFRPAVPPSGSSCANSRVLPTTSSVSVCREWTWVPSVSCCGPLKNANWFTTSSKRFAVPA